VVSFLQSRLIYGEPSQSNVCSLLSRANKTMLCNIISKGFLKQLTIKTNGKNSRRFDRSLVIIKRTVENKNLHRYKVTKGQKYVRKMYEVKICKRR